MTGGTERLAVAVEGRYRVLDRGTERRLTGDEGEDLWPIFSRDGRSAVFNSECIARVGRE